MDMKLLGLCFKKLHLELLISSENPNTTMTILKVKITHEKPYVCLFLSFLYLVMDVFKKRRNHF